MVKRLIVAQVHAGSSPVGHPFNQIRRIVFTKTLNRPTLVLNRNWQAVNVATVARALVLLWNESARFVDPSDYQTYTWEDWSKLRPADRFDLAPGLRAGGVYADVARNRKASAL